MAPRPIITASHPVWASIRRVFRMRNIAVTNNRNLHGSFNLLYNRPIWLTAIALFRFYHVQLQQQHCPLERLKPPPQHYCWHHPTLADFYRYRQADAITNSLHYLQHQIRITHHAHPSPRPATFFTGQPILISIISGFNFSHSTAPSAITDGSLPKICTAIGRSLG